VFGFSPNGATVRLKADTTVRGARYNRVVLLRTDRATRACYRTDGGQVVYGFPDAVVHARCADDVAVVRRPPHHDRVPVTCRGGGLTTEGESVASRGILLDLKGMHHLLECNGDTAWVEAGMTWHQVAEALRPRGLDYTSAPLNMLSTVGGPLGVGGIDVNSPRHGCAADQVVELEVVTPTGEIVRVKDGDDYLERVLLGYGQYGVITKARIKVRPYRRMAVRHYLYTDVGVALADMRRLVEEDAVDACAILTLRDDVVALIVGFEGAVKDFPDLALRNRAEPFVYARMATRYAMRPWRLGEIGFLMRRKKDLLPALLDPLFLHEGVLCDRTVVFSRLIWRYWGGPQVVIPDLAITKANFEAAARRGIDVCKRYFPYFTLYAVMIRKFGNRPRYEMSAIPATSDDHVCGIEFSPLLEGASYSRDHFQRFKNAIYDVGLDLGGSYYRFGGVMKPYVRRIFGDEMVDRHRAMKQALDPAFILNRDVVFDPPESANRSKNPA
jgi:FAD/FMN-containing dehydrogenase